MFTVLQRILECYYSSVLPTDEELAHVVPSEDPHGHDSIVLTPGQDLEPMTPQFTPAPPIPEVVGLIPSLLIKSQAWQHQRLSKICKYFF